MKRRIHLLTVIGTLTLAAGLLALVAFVLVGLAGILEDRALAVIELLFCAMMILYLLCSLMADNTCENKKFALAAWGFTSLTALSGGFIMSGQITFYEIIPFLLLGYLVLAIVSVVLTARGISGKGNGMQYLLASILPLLYTPLCSWVIFAWDTPMGMLVFTPTAVLLFGIYVVLDLIYYHSCLKQAPELNPCDSPPYTK